MNALTGSKPHSVEGSSEACQQSHTSISMSNTYACLDTPLSSRSSTHIFVQETPFPVRGRGRVEKEKNRRQSGWARYQRADRVRTPSKEQSHPDHTHDLSALGAGCFPRRVRCISVSPGTFPTALTRKLTERLSVRVAATAIPPSTHEEGKKTRWIT